MSQYCTDVKALKKAMIDAGFDTIAQLAIASGIDRNTLGKVLKGIKKPTADVMYKLVKAFKLAPDSAGSIFFTKNLRQM